jgi:Flp pilus assembly protein TadD
MKFTHNFRPSCQGAVYTSLALAVLIVGQAQAQMTIGNARPNLPMVQPIPGVINGRVGPADPADMLSMHLRTLAVAPRSLSALLGAGDSALAIGDPNAALGFYARAEQVDARNGKAKAGLASALVMLERADDALPLFAQAVSLGVPEDEIARDRGLAYDLRGDSRRAQKDYALALKRRPDDETTRRYALSLGISGNRAEAMTLLDPLLRKQDQSAWRARAFILAMTGDVPGANGIARQVMPANLASTMSPFLARLPQLNAADRAHAVDFGTMPSSGTNMASVEIGDPFHATGSATGPSSGLIPTGTPLGMQADNAPAAKAAPLSREARRRPGREVLTMGGAQLGASVAPVQAAPAMPKPATVFAAPSAVVQAVPNRPATRVAAAPPVVVAPPVVEPVSQDDTKPAFEVAARPTVVARRVDPGTRVETRPETVPIGETKPPVARPVFGPSAEVAMITPPPARATPSFAPKTAPKPVAVVPMSRLASILAGLTPEMESPSEALPTAAQAKAARRLAQRKAAEAAAVAADLKAEKEAKAALLAEERRNPARLWVQVATGSNELGLPTTWSRIRDDNETALKGRSAWSVPFKASNRLLVGPMKSPADARALVNTLAKGGLSANTFSSEVGQEVFKVGGK